MAHSACLAASRDPPAGSRQTPPSLDEDADLFCVEQQRQCGLQRQIDRLAWQSWWRRSGWYARVYKVVNFYGQNFNKAKNLLDPIVSKKLAVEVATETPITTQPVTKVVTPKVVTE